MTAYGRAEIKSPLGMITVEVQSLNRKFLDLAVLLPKEFSSFETKVRQQVSSRVKRGKVSVKVSVQYTGETPVSVKPNLPLARQIKDAWELMEKDLHIACEIDLNVLAQMPDIFQFSSEKESEGKWEQLLLETLDKALQDAVNMRKQEGAAIKQDFEGRLSNLGKFLTEVSALAPEVRERNREKLRQTLSEVMEEGDELEERLLREACLFAEKVDIEEEITRLSSHLEQFGSKMNGNGEPVGKTLEFILQEMQREVNTLSLIHI